MKKTIRLAVFTMALTSLISCGTSKGLNLFSVQEDKTFGQQVSAEIENNPNEYPILDSAKYAAAYRHLYTIRNSILNSGKVQYKEDFVWRVRIVHDDNTQNAFCTPGGYIYVYTGLIKYLESEDALAGVLAHEIAHADYRHSTRQMTKMFGVEVVLEVLAGNLQLAKEVTSGLINLKFSRSHETEADKASVAYLCNTDYNAAGGAKFFEKIEAQGGSSLPQWLSTHPNPSNRIQNFYTTAIELGCKGKNDHKERYQQLIRSLPK